MSDIPEPSLSTALLRTALGHIDDVLLITEAEPYDMPGPRIIYVNEAFTRMTGYTLEDVYGKSPRILQGPKTSPEERAKIREAWRRPSAHSSRSSRGCSTWRSSTSTLVGG